MWFLSVLAFVLGVLTNSVCFSLTCNKPITVLTPIPFKSQALLHIGGLLQHHIVSHRIRVCLWQVDCILILTCHPGHTCAHMHARTHTHSSSVCTQTHSALDNTMTQHIMLDIFSVVLSVNESLAHYETFVHIIRRNAFLQSFIYVLTVIVKHNSPQKAHSCI